MYESRQDRDTRCDKLQKQFVHTNSQQILQNTETLISKYRRSNDEIQQGITWLTWLVTREDS